MTAVVSSHRAREPTPMRSLNELLSRVAHPTAASATVPPTYTAAPPAHDPYSSDEHDAASISSKGAIPETVNVFNDPTASAFCSIEPVAAPAPAPAPCQPKASAPGRNPALARIDALLSQRRFAARRRPSPAPNTDVAALSTAQAEPVSPIADASSTKSAEDHRLSLTSSPSPTVDADVVLVTSADFEPFVEPPPEQLRPSTSQGSMSHESSYALGRRGSLRSLGNYLADPPELRIECCDPQGGDNSLTAEPRSGVFLKAESEPLRFDPLCLTSGPDAMGARQGTLAPGQPRSSFMSSMKAKSVFVKDIDAGRRGLGDAGDCQTVEVHRVVARGDEALAARPEQPFALAMAINTTAVMAEEPTQPVNTTPMALLVPAVIGGVVLVALLAVAIYLLATMV